MELGRNHQGEQVHLLHGRSKRPVTTAKRSTNRCLVGALPWPLGWLLLAALPCRGINRILDDWLVEGWVGNEELQVLPRGGISRKHGRMRISRPLVWPCWRRVCLLCAASLWLLRNPSCQPALPRWHSLRNPCAWSGF